MLCADDNHMKTYSQPSERLATDKRGFRLGQCKGQRSSAMPESALPIVAGNVWQCLPTRHENPQHSTLLLAHGE